MTQAQLIAEIQRQYNNNYHSAIKNIVIQNTTITEAIILDFSNTLRTRHLGLTSYQIFFTDVIFNEKLSFKDFDHYTEQYTFTETTFIGDVDFTGAEFIHPINFINTTFQQKVNFTGITFRKDVKFDGATFIQDIKFDDATFSEEVDFTKATFGGTVDFIGTTFKQKADFNKKTFTHSINFTKAEFRGIVDFNGTIFLQTIHTKNIHTLFNGAIFKQDMDFTNTVFGCPVDFTDTTFTKAVYFNNLKFIHNINFTGTQFQDIADFNGTIFIQDTKFDGATFNQDVDFTNTDFIGIVNFINTTFKQKVDFKGLKFIQDINFTGTLFNGIVDFNRTTFTQDTKFDGATFFEEIDFTKTTFDGTVDFIGTTFEQKADFNKKTFIYNINFTKAVFKGIADFNGTIFLQTIYTQNIHTLFNGAIFKQDMDFTKTIFGDIVDFIGTTFEQKASFIKTIFAQDTKFDGVTFTMNTKFDGTTFVKEVDFTKALFGSTVDFIGTTFEQKVDFDNLIFSHSINFIKAILRKTGKFINTRFKQKVNFKESELTNCNFTNSIFKKDEKDGESYKVNFENSTIIGCNFEKSEFHNEADFKEAELTNCRFVFTRFIGEADFKRAKFYDKKNKFEYTQFNDRGAFWGCYFEKPITFKNIILSKDSHVYFGEVNKYIKAPNDKEYFKYPKTYQVTDEYIKNLEKTLKISIDIKDKESYKDFKERVVKKIVPQKITIKNTIINGRLDFNNDNINILDMKGSVVAGTLSRILFRPQCANWETATLLKHEELKIDNLIRALEYKAEEKDLYENELLEQIFQKGLLFEILLGLFGSIFCTLLLPIILPLSIIKCIVTPKNYNTNKIPSTNKSSIKLITEWLSLWIGKVSNNHGQSWVQGIIFTTTVWFICFRIFFIWLPKDNLQTPISMLDWLLKEYENLTSVKSFFSHMIEYFNPTNYELLIKFFDSSVNGVVKFIGAFWYLLGKALIPYGAFEVVQAFRKYNKID